MTDAIPPLIPGATDTTFATVARGPAEPGAFTATVVVVGPRARLAGCGRFLPRGESMGMRVVLIPSDAPGPSRIVARGHEVAIEGLRPQFVDNAVAALRLSDLPTVVWWRGGRLSELDGLAQVADRLLLDAEDPIPAWRRLTALSERTAVSDLRWAALTPWRALTAQFFDIPEVLAVAPELRRLELSGGDAASMRLFAGWLASQLERSSADAPRFTDEPGPPLSGVRLEGGGFELILRLLPGATCVETSVLRSNQSQRRTVALTARTPAALLDDELRVGAHDVAFERAVRALGLDADR